MANTNQIADDPNLAITTRVMPKQNKPMQTKKGNLGLIFARPYSSDLQCREAAGRIFVSMLLKECVPAALAR
jgi:hypothetical protein